MGTKKWLVLVFCFITSVVFSQKTLKDTDENKYRINLPEYWGKGYKYLRILNTILSEQVDVLKDKELCGDECNTGYRVEVYITNPKMEEYRYSKVLQWANTNTRGLTNNRRLVNLETGQYEPSLNNYAPVNNSQDRWQFRGLYSFNCYLLVIDKDDKITHKLILVSDDELWDKKMITDLSLHTQLTPAAYLEANYEKLYPADFEVYSIIENKILALKN
jgi:hypothetical protein